MKVLLIKNCPQGKIGEIKEVKDGLALNYLLPQKIATLPTKQNIFQLENQRRKNVNNVAIDLPKQDKLVHALSSIVLNIEVKVNQQNHLYAAINEQQIREAIRKQLNIDLPSKFLDILQNVKKLGTQDLKVLLNKQPLIIKISVNKKTE